MAVRVDLDLMPLGDISDRSLDQRAGACLVISRLGPHVDAQDGKIGHDIVGAAAIDLGRIDRQRFVHPGFQEHCQVSRGDHAIAAVFRIAPRMGRTTADRKIEIATSRSCAGERTVRQRARLIG